MTLCSPLFLLTGFTLAAMLPILIKLIIAGLIAYVLFWALSRIGLPEPFGKIALVIIVLIVAIYCITLLAEIG
jgi:hypothetical protein